MSSVGLAIKVLRTKKEWSLVKVANKIKKSPSFLSEVERGGKIPNLVLLKKIAKAFKVDVSLLRDLAVADKQDMVSKKIEKQYEGFTVVEILIVVAIIGLIAAIAIPNLMRSRNKLKDGKVIIKRYEPRRQWTQMIMMPCGKSFMMIPMVHIDDEDWVVTIGKFEKGKKYRTKDLYVTKNFYNNIQKGDYIDVRERKDIKYRDEIQKIRK